MRKNMVQSINDALRIGLAKHPNLILIGEDLAFGGVFRCTAGLLKDYGPKRIINSPITEQGIVGFSLGASMAGNKVVAEIQFADYLHPGFDQIMNEISKNRYRSGGAFSSESLVIRAPFGAVGHGGLYHSQSPEAHYCIPGMRIVVPSNAARAKGLLLAAIENPDPTIIFEPKALYRSSEEEVSEGMFKLPLDKADVIRDGRDVTVVSWGSPLQHITTKAAALDQEGIFCEVIDLSSIYPVDYATIATSVKKTGRLVIISEAPRSNNVAAFIAAEVQERCMDQLKGPISRVCGWDTPFPLVYETFYLNLAMRFEKAVRNLVTFY